ncbi:MAG: glycosyl hydrolase family 28-related protein [Chloroflexia bacterium]
MAKSVTCVVVGPTGSGTNADYICDGTADQVEINSAITTASAASSSTPSVVRLLPGTYTVDAPIFMKANVVLEGSGLGVSFIQVAAAFPNANSEVIIAAGTASGTDTVVNAPVIGDTALGASSFAGYAPGDHCILYSADDFESTSDNAGRKRGEFVRVESVASTTMNIYGMVRDAYTTTPAIQKINLAENMGLRNFDVKDLGTARNPIPALIRFRYARNLLCEQPSTA